MIDFWKLEPPGPWRESGGEAEVSGLCTQGSRREAEGTVGVRQEASLAQMLVLQKQAVPIRHGGHWEGL